MNKEINAPRVLLASELDDIAGGQQASSSAVRENADTAERVCGKGNVAEVTDKGFKCK